LPIRTPYTPKRGTFVLYVHYGRTLTSRRQAETRVWLEAGFWRGGRVRGILDRWPRGGTLRPGEGSLGRHALPTSMGVDEKATRGPRRVLIIKAVGKFKRAGERQGGAKRPGPDQAYGQGYEESILPALS